MRRNPQSLLPCSVLSEHATPCKINNQRIVFLNSKSAVTPARSLWRQHIGVSGDFANHPRGSQLNRK
jgi:hypothetical protein